MDDDLLKPSLDANTAQPIYSTGALIATAFFGGAFAVPFLAFENSRRLGRVARDALWIVVALAAAAGLVLWLSATVPEEDSSRTIRLWNRGGGFVLAGGFYLLHQRAYRAMHHTGVEPPKPYVAVILAVVAGIVITVGVIEAVRAGVIALPAL